MTTRQGAARRCRAALFFAVATIVAGASGCVTGARIPGDVPSRDDLAARNDPFLDTVQVRTFRWFWDHTDPRTGLTPDRWPTRSFSSVAAIGFGLSAYVVGVER